MTSTRCAHARYGITCEEYGDLQRQAQNRCQICGIPADDTPHGLLHIDHEAGRGEWAVRGLLCSRCNTQLDSNVHVLDAAAVARYLCNPWYRSKFAELGISLSPTPQPSVGSAVETSDGRTWHRDELGWGRRNRHGRVLQPIGWATLTRRYGPRIRQIVKAAKEADGG